MTNFNLSINYILILGLSLFSLCGASEQTEKENRPPISELQRDAELTANSVIESGVAESLKRKSSAIETDLNEKTSSSLNASFKKPRQMYSETDRTNSLKLSGKDSLPNSSDLSNGSNFSGISVPHEILLHIFSKLSIGDICQVSQVCTLWHNLAEEPFLWRLLHQTVLKDYPEAEATKETAKKHYLRVHVNTLSDLDKISFLVGKYELNKDHPFKDSQYFLEYPLLYSKNNLLILDEKAAQSIPYFFDLKVTLNDRGISGFMRDPNFKPSPQTAYSFIEKCAQNNCQAAMKTKIYSLMYGRYGYKEDPQAARYYIEELIKQGLNLGRRMKIRGMNYRMFGYDEDFLVLQDYIEVLIDQGHLFAIKKKVEGLRVGSYGYKKDRKISNLYYKGHFLAVATEALKKTTYNYDLQAVASYFAAYSKRRKLSKDLWTFSGDRKEFRRKILGQASQYCKYSQDLSKLKAWLEEHSSQGNRWAQYLKAQGLKYGIFGFKQDHEEANRYIWQNNLPY